MKKRYRRLTQLIVVGCVCPILLLTALGQEQNWAAEGYSRTNREALLEMMIDPPCDFEISQKKASDFGDFFVAESPVVRGEKTILQQTPYETTLTTIQGENPGPTIFVVAGLHGDEKAGWYTASLLKNVSIKAGTLCVLSPANSLGAKNDTRYVVDRLDLNRSFPGKPDGNPAEQIANAILSEIRQQKPVLLLDLHEARISTKSDVDFLGSSLIYSDLEGIEDLFFEMISATQMGELCSEPFSYYAPAPAGSINQTATEQLGVPTFTVETFRGYPIERRISDQLALVSYILRFYELI